MLQKCRRCRCNTVTAVTTMVIYAEFLPLYYPYPSISSPTTMPQQ